MVVILFSVLAVVWFIFSWLGWVAYYYTRDNDDAFWATVFTVAFIMFCANIAVRV